MRYGCGILSHIEFPILLKLIRPGSSWSAGRTQGRFMAKWSFQ